MAGPVIPVILPPARSEPSKVTCPECGHVFVDPDPPEPWWAVLAVLGCFALAIWLILTLGYWIGENTGQHTDPITLAEVLAEQWEAVTTLAGRIW